MIKYRRAKKLLEEYEHCPMCGRKHTLIFAFAGHWPVKETGVWYANIRNCIICPACKSVWTSERAFLDLATDKLWQKVLKEEGWFDD